MRDFFTEWVYQNQDHIVIRKAKNDEASVKINYIFLDKLARNPNSMLRLFVLRHEHVISH